MNTQVHSTSVDLKVSVAETDSSCQSDGSQLEVIA